MVTGVAVVVEGVEPVVGVGLILRVLVTVIMLPLTEATVPKTAGFIIVPPLTPTPPCPPQEPTPTLAPTVADTDVEARAGSAKAKVANVAKPARPETYFTYFLFCINFKIICN